MADELLEILTEKERERLKKSNNSPEAEEEKPKKSQADILVEIGSSALLFHDDLRVTYAAITINDHQEIWPIRNKFFRHWLIGRYYNTTGKAPNSDAISQALNVLEAKAIFEGQENKLNLRVAEYKGAFWYDLADSKWGAIKVTPDGWSIETKPPIIFRRYKNTASQVEPKGDKEDLWRLLDFINIPSLEEQYLLLVYVVSCLIPKIPHIIPPFSGEKGAAKSTSLRVLRRLVDPAHRELLTLPGDKNELALMLSNNYMVSFDNLDNLQAWQSDMLCCAATGGGISKRELYSDDDEVILSFLRCVTLNGINLVATRSDLLDRAILFELERIKPENRREESDFWTDFESARPYILGGMFSALSEAMKIYPTVKLSSLPRMADFCRWGYAIAEALGIGGETFLKAYYLNIGKANEEAINNNPVASAILAFMASKTEWKGTARELLDELQDIARSECINTLNKYWPQEANSLMRRLKHAKSNLLDSGITYDQYRLSDYKRTRILQLQRITKEPSKSSISSIFSNGVGSFKDDTKALNNTVHISSGNEASNYQALDGMDGKDDIFASFGKVVGYDK